MHLKIGDQSEKTLGVLLSLKLVNNSVHRAQRLNAVKNRLHSVEPAFSTECTFCGASPLITANIITFFHTLPIS